MSVIYVLRAGSFCKVGHTRNLLRRLTNIRMCCPLEVELHARVDIPSGKAVLIELEAHKALKAHHQRGEWFRVGARVALSAVVAAMHAVTPLPALSAEDISARHRAFMGKGRGPYKLKRRRSQSLKIGLKYSGESAQNQTRRKDAPP